MIELKPCPFCGGKAFVREYANGHNCDGFIAKYYVGCDKCKISFQRESVFHLVNGQPKFLKNGYDDAVSAWNRRADND